MQIGLSSMPDRVPDPTSTDPGAQTSGPGFNRLIAAAQAEADRRKSIAAQSGASADQFSEQGWLAIVKAHGAEIGLGAAANAITKDSHGQFTVVNSALRARVINYRNDPLVRSVMAVKRAGDGKAVLNAELGRQPTDAELRVADALGAKAAAKLITTRQSTPNASAAIVSPDAAKANRAAFYRPDGSPQTVNDVLVKLMKPADAAAGPDVERLLAGHAAFANPTAATTPASAQAMPTKGMTPEMAANLRARAAFASASSPTALAPKQRVAPPLPPDLALVGGTIGNLSMPGSATGQTAPTGGKVSGWRAQMVGEVTQQIEHPESTVTNLPSKVTIPAPVFGHHSAANLVASAAPVTPEPQQLGPQLVPIGVVAASNPAGGLRGTCECIDGRAYCSHAAGVRDHGATLIGRGIADGPDIGATFAADQRHADAARARPASAGGSRRDGLGACRDGRTPRRACHRSPQPIWAKRWDVATGVGFACIRLRGGKPRYGGVEPNPTRHRQASDRAATSQARRSRRSSLPRSIGRRPRCNRLRNRSRP